MLIAGPFAAVMSRPRAQSANADRLPLVVVILVHVQGLHYRRCVGAEGAEEHTCGIASRGQSLGFAGEAANL